MEYDISGSGVWTDLNQPTYSMAPMPYWPVRPPCAAGTLYDQTKAFCPDEQLQAAWQDSACTASPWTPISLAHPLLQIPHGHAIKYLRAVIAGCQAQPPELARVMKNIQSRQKITDENEFIVYACFVFRKDYQQVALAFSAVFRRLSEGAVRMRFQRMTQKKGNEELLRLSNEIRRRERGARV
jgi:hypothetical protein